MVLALELLHLSFNSCRRAPGEHGSYCDCITCIYGSSTAGMHTDFSDNVSQLKKEQGKAQTLS